jgi:TPR repeat protein
MGAKKDPVEALKWYLLAAEQGDAKAQFASGVCYEIGQGTEKNPDLAFKMYKSAARQANVKSMVALGLCYQKGIGCTADTSMAFECYQEAANRDRYGIFLTDIMIRGECTTL